MPFTFLAHQAPVLPLKRWQPSLDGVALVVGSTTPDLARATEHLPWPYLFGHPTWFDGHKPDQIVSWCLVVGLLITWSARRLVLPRLAGHLPDLGRFHLRDIRLVGRNRHRWWMVVLCVEIGAVTHSLLDMVTHSDRGIVLPGFDDHLFDVAGHSIETANLVQVVASVGLSIATVWLLWVMGTNREIAEWSDWEPVPTQTPPHHRAVVTAVLVAAGLTGVFAATQLHRGSRVALMTWVFAGWAALCAIAVFVRRPDDTLAPDERTARRRAVPAASGAPAR